MTQNNMHSSLVDSLISYPTNAVRRLFIEGYQLLTKAKDKDFKLQELKIYEENQNQQNICQDWQKTKKSTAPTTSVSSTFYKFMVRLHWVKIITLIMLTTLLNVLAFYRPIALENLLNIGKNIGQKSDGYVYILYYVIFELVRTVIQEIKWINHIEFDMHFNTSFKTLVYNKILKLSGSSKKYLETGILNSYYNEDSGIIARSIHQIYEIAIAPFTIVAGTYQLYNEIGFLGIIAPLVIVLTLITQSFRMKQVKGLEKENSKLGDKKSKIINEYISGMKILKYYGWETISEEKILGIRKDQEVLHNKIHKHYEIGSQFIHNIPGLYILLVFIYLSFTDYPLSLTKFLVINAIIDVLKNPFSQIYWNINDFTKIKISLTKMGNFLLSQEKTEEQTQNQVEEGEIMMQGCKFQYENMRVREEENKRKVLTEKLAKHYEGKEDKSEDLLNLEEEIPTVLEIEELKIEKGELAGIVGKVGSGKSTLISGILGEVYKSEGVCFRNGRIAYCPQIAWLKNSSIKENIVFGSAFDEERYLDVLKRCQLEEDLKVLEKGDETLVGEKGIKLSGGQKQRVSIARCLYSESEIYIFDDFLSALDANVGKNIFFNVIQHLHTQGKTVVIVLNAIEYLKYCDKTIFIKDGKIQIEEEFTKLKKINSEFFSSLENEQKKENSEKRQQAIEKQEEDINVNDKLNESTESEETMENRKVTEEKQKDQKKAEEQISVVHCLYRFITDNFTAKNIILVVLVVSYECLGIVYKWWLGCWTKNQDYFMYYALGAVLFYLSLVLISYLRSIGMKSTGLEVGNKVHQKYLKTLFKTPMNWFDDKPVGEILDRAIKYQNRIDHQIIWALNWSLSLVSSFLISLMMVVSQTPLNLLLILALFFIFYRLNLCVRKPSDNIINHLNQQHEKRSSFLQETVTGTSVIRAFQRNDNYKKGQMNFNKNILNLRMNIHYLRGSFLSLLMSIASNIIIASIAFFIIQNLSTRTEPLSSDEEIMISLTINSSIWMGSMISWFFQCKLWMGEIFLHVNRIYDWILNNPSEKSFTQPQPKENWLTNGSVSVQNISYRYKPDLPLVIKNISFDVKEKQKIGIVGRTGSGKSTMTLGMLRILQICENEDKSEGNLIMDNTNVSEIGLHHLRHSVAMIPQDPLLFSGTLKSNIDPFGKYSDEEIADSLKKAHIWDDLKEESSEEDPVKKKIYSKVDEEGSNYSLGQRQLICLARALIRNPKILLMDEATASIDLKTDKLIQEMITKEFKDATVITIAHRLNTIINYDKILVLDKGTVQEYDSPCNLVENEDSFLGKSIRKVGEQYAQRMISLAREKQ